MFFCFVSASLKLAQHDITNKNLGYIRISYHSIFYVSVSNKHITAAPTHIINYICLKFKIDHQNIQFKPYESTYVTEDWTNRVSGCGT